MPHNTVGERRAADPCLGVINIHVVSWKSHETGTDTRQTRTERSRRTPPWVPGQAEGYTEFTVPDRLRGTSN